MNDENPDQRLTRERHEIQDWLLKYFGQDIPTLLAYEIAQQHRLGGPLLAWTKISR